MLFRSDEASSGLCHPDVARDLNNLAQVLQDTNLLQEAEPLMRRALNILIRLTRATGHQHPHLQVFVNNYKILLGAMGLAETEIPTRLRQLAPDFFAAPEA